MARDTGSPRVDAEVDTVIDTEGIGGRRDLEGKNWGLRFLKRVPLTGERRASINCTDPSDYHRPRARLEQGRAADGRAEERHEEGLSPTQTSVRRPT